MELQREIFFKQIGGKIAYYRMLAGMQQAELANKAFISQSTLSRIEHGTYNKNLSFSLLLDIAKGLELDPTLLFSFNEKEKSMWLKLNS